MKDNKRLFQLFDAYYNGTASDQDERELMRLLEAETDEEIAGLLRKKWEEEDGGRLSLTEEGRRKILETLNAVPDEEAPVRTLSMPGRSFVRRMATAAAVILVLSLTAVFVWNKKKDGTIAAKIPVAPVQTDAAPATEKAVLTLADGSRVVLDSNGNGGVAPQGETRVVKTPGQLVYSPGETAGEVLFNTVATPRGGQYRLVLSDGTRVWLNAATSLRFPAAFAAKDRTVELNGEAYFEVAHNASKPFRVVSGEMQIQVLGTHFNVNSYGDEPVARTTLLQGKVLVKNREKFLYLHPGQQAIAKREGGVENLLTVDHQADLDAVMAWKNGLFVFDNSDIYKILRDLSRWYDVDVQIDAGLGGKELFGIVNRNSPLSSVMKALKSGSPVSFTYRMEGKKLIVQAVKN